jgi:hypothetical protein
VCVQRQREREKKQRVNKVFFEKKNELPLKKSKNILKKCPGTRTQDSDTLVTWYQGSDLRREDLYTSVGVMKD